MAKGDVEVHPQGDSWAVKVEGESSPRSTHDRKSDAVDSGRALAKSMRVEFIEKTVTIASTRQRLRPARCFGGRGQGIDPPAAA